MLAKYETLYESSLSNLEVMKDLYMSMILSMTFALVFAIVLPILTGNDPTATVAAVIVLFVFVQLGFYAMIRATSPYDPIWFHPDERAPGDLKLWASLGIGGGLSFLIIGITAAGMFGYGPGLPGLLWFIDDVRLPLYLAVPISPLFITGVVLRSEEQAITARDGEFPSFIRALGATERERQTVDDHRRVDHAARQELRRPLAVDRAALPPAQHADQHRGRVGAVHVRHTVVPHPEVLRDVPRRPGMDGRRSEDARRTDRRT